MRFRFEHCRKKPYRWLIGVLLVVVSAGIVTAGWDSSASAAEKGYIPPPPYRDKESKFREYMRSWLDLKRDKIVMQERDYSCGAAALATLIRYHWEEPVTETQIIKAVDKMLTPEEMQDRIKKGLSITDLRRVAVKLGYLSTIGKVKFEKLEESKIPVVVGIVVNGFDHFVVFRGTDDRFVYLSDPARGHVREPIAEFKKQWQKNAILIVVKKGRSQIAPRRSQ